MFESLQKLPPSERLAAIHAALLVLRGRHHLQKPHDRAWNRSAAEIVSEIEQQERIPLHVLEPADADAYALVLGRIAERAIQAPPPDDTVRATLARVRRKYSRELPVVWTETLPLDAFTYAQQLYKKAVALERAGLADDAMGAYGEIVAHVGGAEDGALCALLAKVHVNRGLMLTHAGRFEDALRAYDAAIAYRGRSEPEIREQVAKAFVNKAFVLAQTGRTSEEHLAYDDLARTFADETEPETVNEVVRGLFNRCLRLRELGRLRESMFACTYLDEHFHDSKAPGVRPFIAKALIHKAVLHGELGDLHNEIKTYDQVIFEYGEQDEMAEQVARALFNKGVACGDLGMARAELACYEEVISRFADHSDADVKEHVAKAMTNRAAVLENSRVAGPRHVSPPEDPLLR